jgi:hypothetical protein
MLHPERESLIAAVYGVQAPHLRGRLMSDGGIRIENRDRVNAPPPKAFADRDPRAAPDAKAVDQVGPVMREQELFDASRNLSRIHRRQGQIPTKSQRIQAAGKRPERPGPMDHTEVRFYGSIVNTVTKHMRPEPGAERGPRMRTDIARVTSTDLH